MKYPYLVSTSYKDIVTPQEPITREQARLLSEKKFFPDGSPIPEEVMIIHGKLDIPSREEPIGQPTLSEFVVRTLNCIVASPEQITNWWNSLVKDRKKQEEIEQKIDVATQHTKRTIFDVLNS
jgi:hypothetical protein